MSDTLDVINTLKPHEDDVTRSAFRLVELLTGVYILAAVKIPPSKILPCFCGLFCGHLSFIKVF